MYQLCPFNFCLFQDKKQIHGFLQASCCKNLYYSKKVNATKRHASLYKCITFTWYYQPLHWTLCKILGKDNHLYTFLCQVFFIAWRVISDLPCTCLWSWVKAGGCWSIRIREDEGSSCLFLSSSRELGKMCWDTQKLFKCANLPCSHHTQQVPQ